ALGRPRLLQPAKGLSMSRPQPRFTASQKRDHVKSLLRLGGGATPPGSRIDLFARQIGVRRQTLYRWLQDDSLRPGRDMPHEEPRPSRSRFDVDTNMLTVVAQEQTRQQAYEKLKDAGLVDVAYSTFCRAVDRTPPDVLAGALSGRKAMADNRVYTK